MLQDLEQRYNKLRVEVQMAQDAEEPVTLDEVVRRVMRKEKQASATFAGTRASNTASKSAPPIPGTDILLRSVFISRVSVHVTVIILYSCHFYLQDASLVCACTNELER